MPVLEVDGKFLAQSYAISRYLARKFGLAGKDDFESAQIDSYADFIKDFGAEIRPYFVVALGRVKGDKDELHKTVYVPVLEKSMTILEKILKESGSGFLAKSGVSWVDFYLASFTETLEGLGEGDIKKYQGIMEHKERVYGLPQLKKYLEGRPKTRT